MKSRYRFKTLPSTYRPRELAYVLEATEDSLRLLMPTWRERMVNFIVRLVIFVGFWVAASLFVGILQLQSLPRFVSVITGTIVALILIVAYFFSGLDDRLATNVELYLAARRHGRVLNVHVQQIRPGKTRYVQFVMFADDPKEEWFQVQTTKGKLQEALKLAKDMSALT